MKARAIYYRVQCKACGAKYKTMPMLYTIANKFKPKFWDCTCGGKVVRECEIKRKKL